MIGMDLKNLKMYFNRTPWGFVLAQVYLILNPYQDGSLTTLVLTLEFDIQYGLVLLVALWAFG